ncbi:hypothetical protein QCA50_004918 [Cerrena zonata]|uniref:CFEM domain-containing protein n=1 Tax=Cerrena zonata TaxID=2478898 RepID=A0AAW0GK48_9APHY
MMFARMFSLPIPLMLLVWPIAQVLAQGSLTPPPVSAPSETSTSASVSRSGSASVSASAASSGSASGNASSSASATSSANFPSLSGYSPCVANCLGMAVSQTGCSSLVEVQCFCTNMTLFTSSIVSCISSGCPTDLNNAEALSQQFCNIASPSVSLSFPSPPPTASSSSSASSSSGSSGSTSSSSSTSSAPSTSTTGDNSGAGRMFENVVEKNTILAVLAASGVVWLGVASLW